MQAAVSDGFRGGTIPQAYTAEHPAFASVELVYRWDGALGGRLLGAVPVTLEDREFTLALTRRSATEEDCRSLRALASEPGLIVMKPQSEEYLGEVLANLYAHAKAGDLAVTAGVRNSVRILPRGEQIAAELWQTVPRDILHIHLGVFSYPTDLEDPDFADTVAWCETFAERELADDYTNPSLTVRLDMEPLHSGQEAEGALVISNSRATAVNLAVNQYANLREEGGTAVGLLTGLYLANTATWTQALIQPGTSERFSFIVGTASCDPDERGTPSGQYELLLDATTDLFGTEPGPSAGGLIRVPIEVLPVSGD